MKKFTLPVTALILGALMGGCNSANQEVNIKYDSFTLPNGLKVVLQQDHSDPVVAVAIQYHVGSARERVGKTGFAHFFEHMLFQRSENLPRNAFFEKISALGGDFNGSTDSDGTRYHEIVPRDALEKVLWMESDRMGFFINTVTQGGLEREIDVVSNEKRQMYDTRPYGQLLPIFSRYAYPEGHPYSWTTIGELDDLRAATVQDVKDFYKTYYMPNNATLVISGDFDKAEAKVLVEKYFGEIPAGEHVVAMPPMPAPLDSDVKVSHEDAYASMPLLAVSFPAVPTYHPDSYALQMLTQLLGDGKKSPLYKVLVDRKKLSPEVSSWYYDRELAGNLMFIVPAFAGVDLDDVHAAIGEAFAMFEEEGVDAGTMEGFKAVAEMRFYNSMSGVMSRALNMAREDVFGGDPMRGVKEMEAFNSVTKEQVMAAYGKYIKDKNSLQISFVPKGAQALAVDGSATAVVVEEKIADQKMKSGEGALVDDDYEHTPSAMDRSVEPGLLANTPALNPPLIWKEKLPAGMGLWGVTNDEMPVVRFQIDLAGGVLFDSPDKRGVSSLYAETLLAGTRNRTPEEFEEAFSRLGATVNCSAGYEGISIYGSCLSRNLKATMDLLAEVLAEPRFDENEIEKARQMTLTSIAQQDDDITAIANKAARKVLFGKNNILSGQIAGTAGSVAAITVDDIKDYHARCVSPSLADIHMAGNLRHTDARRAIESLSERWTATGAEAPAGIAGATAAPGLYFIDMPGAQQSQIIVCSPAMPQSSDEYYPAVLANYRLGEGSHGILFNELRLKRGYTYGAYSSFRCENYDNRFVVNTKVQGIKTRESVELIKQILESYGAGYTAEDLETTRNSILKSNVGAYETLGALVGMLSDISSYGLSEDYVRERELVLRNFTIDDMHKAISASINPARMSYVVVGDAATQLKGLESCGLGKPVVLDKQGDRK